MVFDRTTFRKHFQLSSKMVFIQSLAKEIGILHRCRIGNWKVLPYCQWTFTMYSFKYFEQCSSALTCKCLALNHSLGPPRSVLWQSLCRKSILCEIPYSQMCISFVYCFRFGFKLLSKRVCFVLISIAVSIGDYNI